MMKNKTRNTVLAKEIKICRNTFSQALGLMFRKKLKNRALVMVFDQEQMVPLHNLFVFQKLDVLFLDRNKKVVERWEGFKPFTMHKPRRKARYVIELPKGTIARTKTRLTDSISF